MEHFPMITMEELSTLLSEGYFVMKPCKNNKNFENEHEYVLRTESIGIDYQINTPLPFNVTDEQIRHSSPYLDNDRKQRSRKMVKQFIDEMNIGDKLIIGKGATKSLYICDIEGPHYFGDSEESTCKIRRRIGNIRRLPEEFQRTYFVSTLRYYE